jgi:hypothetical protein
MKKLWVITRTDPNGKVVETHHKSLDKIGRKIRWALGAHSRYECTGPDVKITIAKEP